MHLCLQITVFCIIRVKFESGDNMRHILMYVDVLKHFHKTIYVRFRVYS